MISNETKKQLQKKKATRKIIQAGIYDTLLSAPTRSGKGVSSVIPTLLSYPGSVIVLDFKGENFDNTSTLNKAKPEGDR
ncbi:MAG: type IV secretory system conjugative DNA transfer family protein [Treponema sp.]|nr:type IV secretory system conjugative DNA transfer family protein [Treponema sp.]